MFGTVGFAGRKTGGAIGRRIADSRTLRDAADPNSDSGRLARMGARIGLRTGEGLRDSSYDLRNSKTLSNTVGGVGQALGGGKISFGKAPSKKDIGEKQNARAEREAARLQPTEAERFQAEQTRRTAQADIRDTEMARESARRITEQTGEQYNNERARHQTVAAQRINDPEIERLQRKRDQFQTRVDNSTNEAARDLAREEVAKAEAALAPLVERQNRSRERYVNVQMTRDPASNTVRERHRQAQREAGQRQRDSVETQERAQRVQRETAPIIDNQRVNNRIQQLAASNNRRDRAFAQTLQRSASGQTRRDNQLQNLLNDLVRENQENNNANNT